MLIEVRTKNCFAFGDEIKFSMKADMRTKRFLTNVHQFGDTNILKVAGIYGSNNAGKTCLVRCIKVIKDVLLHNKVNIMSNLFSNNTIVEMGITFFQNDKVYSYDFKYDKQNEEYIYEKFSELTCDRYGNEKENILILRDIREKVYSCGNNELEKILPLMARNNILIYLVDSDSFQIINEIKQILTDFANKIDVVDMNNIPIRKTIDVLKNENKLQERVVEFIKNADLYLEDFKYVENNPFIVENMSGEEKPEEEALQRKDWIMDQLKLTSVYKGISVPSLLFDSTGTKKIAALASYIVDAISEGRILIIDEMDSSIHFKLSRSIVAMFNNELNTGAQLVFTVHDISLMDCKKLFRKEQIWFVHKDAEGVYVYPLSAFTAEDGVRDTTDIKEKYRKGVLGAVPDPELINSLISLKSRREEDD